MVETIKCDHCGAEARRVVTKEFDGKIMNFCCRGCLQVYEMIREEQEKEKQGGENKPAQEK